MHKIIYSALFKLQLDNAYDFYNQRDSDYSDFLIKSLYSEINILKRFPRIGMSVPEVNVESVREIFVEKYRVIYEIGDGVIEILNLLHFKQRFFLL